MKQIKVGTRVLAIVGDAPYYLAGDTGTVVTNPYGEDDEQLLVQWDAVRDYDGALRVRAGDGLWWINPELVEVLSCCTENSGTATRGHLAASGGLRGHSIGDLYPWSVVGIGYEGWQAFNCETGEYFGPITTYDHAERWAKEVARTRIYVEEHRTVCTHLELTADQRAAGLGLAGWTS